MSDEPAVSVIIPVYNRAKILKRAIKSVLNQTFQNFEIIVVDDASIDNPQVTLASFKDDRINYIRFDKNRNAAVARNVGAKMSKGHYIAFLDSDDEWLPEHLNNKIEILKNKNVEGVYGSCYTFDGKKMTTYLTAGIKPSESVLDFILSGKYRMTTPTLVIKRKPFLNVLFNENYFQHQDREFHLRFTAKYRYTHDINPSVIIYLNNSDRMGRNIKHWSILRFMREYRDQMSDFNFCKYNYDMASTTLYNQGRVKFFYIYIKNILKGNQIPKVYKAKSQILRVPLFGELFNLGEKLVKRFLNHIRN